MDSLIDIVYDENEHGDTASHATGSKTDKPSRSLISSLLGKGNAGGSSQQSAGKNPAWPFRSSETNFEIAKEEYKDSPIEEYVATAFGDEIPEMRDNLIERKHHGEGFFRRHFRAWVNWRNWEVDPDNNEKEIDDPAIEKGNKDR